MTLRKLLARVGLCFSLILPLGAYAAATATPVLAEEGPCDWLNPVDAGSQHAGEIYNPPGIPTGVDAYIMGGGARRLNTCTGTDAGGSMSASYISFEDTDGDAYLGIVQIGQMRCRFQPQQIWGPSPCDTDKRGDLRHFLAISGCNGNVPWPRDLGPASEYQTYKYGIYWNSSILVFKIDDYTVKQFNVSELSCWKDNGDVMTISCETWDNGDSCGDDPGARLAWRQARYRDASFDAHATDFNSPCYLSSTGLYDHYKCYVAGDREVQLYTDR